MKGFKNAARCVLEVFHVASECSEVAIATGSLFIMDEGRLDSNFFCVAISDGV